MKKERGDWRRRVLLGEIMETDEGTGEEECGGMKWSNTLNLILLFMLGLWCALIIKTARLQEIVHACGGRAWNEKWLWPS